MKKLLLILTLFLSKNLLGQTNSFPANGSAGIGTLSPYSWFSGKVLQIQDTRPIIRLAPTTEGGLGTILFKGAYDNKPATPDEFHLNYKSSTTDPMISLNSYFAGHDIFTILGNGKIGIGTMTPSETLSVNGKIRAHEIKVETANWPDYVFEPSYDRPSLPELETFIKENKHLPEIPSAKEVEKNGVSLGEMNAKLLKKIEELTLHLIELNKKLEEQNKKHQKEINDLNNRIKWKNF